MATTADTADRTAQTPPGPGPKGWFETLKRAALRAKDSEITDRAAALTYYAILSVFPALIVMVSLLGVFGQYPETTNAMLEVVSKVGPATAVETFREPIETVVRSKGGAGALLGIGAVIALWSASGYIGAFMRASNEIHGVQEGRPFWKLRPLQVAVTLVLVLLLSLVGVALVVTGPLAQAIGDVIGLGDTAVQIWDIAKWPVVLLIVMTTFATLYHAAPNVRRRFRLLSAGSVLAVLLWVIASAVFAFYVSNFGSYGATYGSLGGVIVFLLWLWITNLALLFGAHLDAEIARERITKDPPPPPADA